MYKPNYETARKEAGFEWKVAGAQGALRELAKVPIKDFNLKPEACIEAYKKGVPLFKEMFGDDVGVPGLMTPAVSYGHVNCLGSELIFPDGGEVGHTHIYKSLEEGIAVLKESPDFFKTGMLSFYLDFKKKMEKAFPGEKVGFPFHAEGPVTTAYELRGDGFFTDIYDNPGLAEEFLKLSTDSIIEFHKFLCSLENVPSVNPERGGMGDDIAAMIPPDMWEELVLPCWEQYYKGFTTGKRYAHVEDLRSDHLKYLEVIGLYRYDPSVSPKINPKIISRECRVPFGWRLPSFILREMDHGEIRDFVFKSAEDGASSVFTYIEEITCNVESVKKIQTFIKAAKTAKEMFDKGISREDIGKLVSPSGRQKLWGNR